MDIYTSAVSESVGANRAHSAAANILTNPQLDPFGKIPEYKFCAAKVEPVAVWAAAE